MPVEVELITPAVPPSQTKAQLEASLRNRLGDRDGYQFPLTQIDDWLAQAYDAYLIATMCAHDIIALDLTTVAAVGGVYVSGVTQWSIGHIWRPTTVFYNGQPLDLVTPEALDGVGDWRSRVTEEDDPPTKWTMITGGAIRFYPLPVFTVAPVVQVSGYCVDPGGLASTGAAAPLAPAGAHIPILDYAEMLARQSKPTVGAHMSLADKAAERFAAFTGIQTKTREKAGR